MNRIANEILHIASELLPRIKATFTRNSEKEERDYNSVFIDFQRFLVTIHNNEEIDTFISRTDTKDSMNIEVRFSDHDEAKAIINHISDMAKKLGKKIDVRVDVENL
jgi:hypothetical protein